MNEWRLDLPLSKPLSLNSRQHHMVKARAVAQVRKDAQIIARAAKIPALDRIVVELHYAPRDSRRRDALNLVATLKPCEDGLVDAGIVPDDTAEFVVPTMPVIDPPTGTQGRLYLLVKEWICPTCHNNGELHDPCDNGSNAHINCTPWPCPECGAA